MKYLSKSEAIYVLKPYGQKIYNCINGGWEYYLKNHTEESFRFEKRTKAGIIRDYIVSIARSEFHNLPEVKILESKHLFLLKIDDKLCIRFKKLKGNFTSSNYPTQQSDLFLEQGELFPEYEIAYLNAGYIIDKDWGNLLGIFITNPNGRSSIRWFIDIKGELLDGFGIGVDITPILPIFPDIPGDIITIKPNIIRKVENNGGQS